MTWNPKDDIYKQFAMTPDHELLLWEDWIMIRDNEAIKLGFRTDRPPIDLAMNNLEKIRAIKEERIILEEAQIPVKARNVRGALFEQPQRLFNKCPCPCENVYEIQRTAAEKGKPKIIIHTGCPEYIQKHEKSLLGETERPQQKHCVKAYEDYKQRRAALFKEKIDKIDPFKSDLKELIVVGYRPKPPLKKEKPLPSISVNQLCDPYRDYLSGVYALRLNNTIVVKHIPDQDVSILKNMQREPWHENNCYSWTYYFNVPENKIGRAKLYMENLGTVTLRYCWKKIKKMIPFIPEEVYDQRFYFNKNEDVISPGQNKIIYFTFISNKPAIYSESWELAFSNISLFDNLGDKFSVHLVGDSFENIRKMSRKIERLENRIDKKAMSMYITGLLNELVIDITSVQHEIYPYKKYFVEGELFIARNMQYFYHQTEVQTLKDTFKVMTGREWDLTLKTWWHAMVRQEFDDRMKYYDQLRKSHNILLRPWYEGDDLLTQKYRAVSLFLAKLADKFYFEFSRVSEWNGVPVSTTDPNQKKSKDDATPTTPIQEGPLTNDIIHNIFYIRMYEHVQTTIETIAGILSSLDLNRWMEFDFCKI